MLKIVFILGLALFALFFGAGNLIFPIKLGWESGSFFYYAIAGFLITGVGMPLLGLIASSSSPGGIPQILREKVSRWFSAFLMISIYLTIGPLFAIPRTSTTSYNIGIVPYTGGEHSAYLFVFSLVYFLMVLVLSLKPSKIIERIGGFLTPALLIILGLLCIVAFFKLGAPVVDPQDIYLDNHSFTQGFTEGYLTMDAIASVAFSIISLNSLRAMNIVKKNDILKYSIMAALVAAICLAAVYISLGWIGNHYPLNAEQIQWITQNQTHEGAYILTNSADTLLGAIAPILVSIVVTLACLTTAIGLTVAISSFFAELLKPYFPSLTYSFYVYFFTVISLILSNQGLNYVIQASIPILTILYPITILVIFLTLLEQIITIPNVAFKTSIVVTSFISITSVLVPDPTTKWLGQFHNILGISLNNLTFSWIIPATIALVLGYLIAYVRKIV